MTTITSLSIRVLLLSVSLAFAWSAPSLVTAADAPGATAVAAGGLHTCALTDGTVKCWGRNYYGQLGNGATNQKSTTPVTVTDVSTATVIAAGYAHSCTGLDDGTVKCWGRNGEGQLGNGTISIKRKRPVTVTGVSTATGLAASYYHTCARLDDGTVQCWGGNWAGQLGDGTKKSSSTPVTVALTGVSPATDVEAGNRHTCARLEDGTVQCWGNNQMGGLGDGTTTDANTPVTVQPFAVPAPNP